MILENNIGWCDDTGNKVTGCDKVSAECKNCYAESGTRARVLRHEGIETWGPKGVRHPVANFSEKVRRLNKLCICDKCHEVFPFACVGRRHDLCAGLAESKCQGQLRRIRFFADSNSDWLDNKWPIETFANLLKDIHDCPNIDFQLLTKRPENFKERARSAELFLVEQPMESNDPRAVLSRWISQWRYGADNNDIDRPPANVWVGVSLRNGEVPKAFYDIPAATRFVSAEPLLKDVTLDISKAMPLHDPEYGDQHEYWEKRKIDWLIVGGESGPNRRDCGLPAILGVVMQCQEYGIPVYVKQDCAQKSGQQGRIPDDIWSLKQFPKL